MHKILVLGPAWVGDMVMAQSLFKQLKIDQPDCQIDVAAPAWTLPLLDRMPEVTGKIALPFKHGQLAFWQRLAFGKSLRSQGFHQAIILTNSLKSALLPWAAKIPVRTSFLGEMRYGLINDIRPLDKTLLKQTVQRFVALGLAKHKTLPSTLPQPKLIADHAHALATCQKLNIALGAQKILGLCPGAEYGEAKRWPLSHYASLANQALEAGWQVWLFGSDKDKPATQEINQKTQQRCVDLGGKTALAEAIDLMSLCHAVVSNDSGLMHVAAALDKKLVAVYGSSDPHHTPPMHPQSVIEYLGLACSPCFERTCPKTGDDHMACLKGISADGVWQTLNQVDIKPS